MKDKKKIVIGLLCTMICVMTIGYAVLAQRLNINGRASIDSTWKVEITNIKESEVTGSAVSKVTPSYTSTTANFSVGLTQPGDSITYNVEISNLGTLNAKVDSINIVMDENDAIKYTTTGIKNGDKLASGEKATLTVKVEYDPNVTSQPSTTTKDITVTINYIQDIVGEVEELTYQAYSIGDTINFAGSNWYVIKNSSSEEDYVTLLKEKTLTNEDLGDYGIEYTCSAEAVVGGMNGCTSEGKTIKLDAMAYYYSDTCHVSGSYGYTDNDSSGCEGHNGYEGSKVKEFLEGTYINTLGSDKLKNVDGYPIRLLSLDDLTNIIGEGFVPTYNYSLSGEDIPDFITSSVVENGYSYYWLMNSAHYNGTWNFNVNEGEYVSLINGHKQIIAWPSCASTPNAHAKIRPVINLLKTSI